MPIKRANSIFHLPFNIMYIIQPTPLFEKKKNKLKRKYPRIEKDYAPLVKKLKQGEFEDAELQGFSGSVYKVRVASDDQRKGKRGGFRVIYYAITKDQIVYLITIYAKAQQEDLSHQQKQDLKILIEKLNKLET